MIAPTTTTRRKVAIWNQFLIQNVNLLICINKIIKTINTVIKGNLKLPALISATLLLPFCPASPSISLYFVMFFLENK